LKRILVTGAAGFIGSHLCERLIADGNFVLGIDNFDPFYNRKIKESNIKNLQTSDKFKLIEDDIRNTESLKRLFETDIEVIVHLAAKAGVRPSIEDPTGYADVNIIGTLAMFEAARKFNVKKFIFASSSSVYGNNQKVPFSETDNVDNPISPYAATKKAGELICFTYHSLYKIDISCLRFFTVYGPRQRPDLAIHKFAKLIMADEAIPVFGDGSMMRDFTYIDDILDGVMGAIEKCRGYEIYNLGESRPIRLDELIGEIEKALDKKAIIKRLPLQPGDVEKTFADVSKAKMMLGYNPKTQISEGLKNFCDWFRKEYN
jgi:UDP-glucuronate 4-epimerase